MTFVVHGATGAQGAPVVAALLAAGHPVQALSRGHSPRHSAVPAIPVDLADVAALTSAYAGARGVFVHMPLTGDPDAPARWATTIGQAALAARPPRIVLSTSGGPIDNPASPFGADKAAALRTLATELRAAGLTVTVLAPRLFLENLLLPPVFDRVTADGVLAYPLPDDQPVAWTSHHDVADAAVAALTAARAPDSVNVGHAPGLTGHELADAFTKHLGRPVTYRHTAPTDFAALMAPLVGEPVAAGLAVLYQALEGHPDVAFPLSTSAAELLNTKPRTVATWLAEL